jgi:hypothetical protein
MQHQHHICNKANGFVQLTCNLWIAMVKVWQFNVMTAAKAHFLFHWVVVDL